MARSLDREGAGVPDVAFVLPDGRIAIIECKGSEASLGTSLGASRRSVNSQGPLSRPTTVVQPQCWEPPFMPHSRNYSKAYTRRITDPKDVRRAINES